MKLLTFITTESLLSVGKAGSLHAHIQICPYTETHYMSIRIIAVIIVDAEIQCRLVASPGRERLGSSVVDHPSGTIFRAIWIKTRPPFLSCRSTPRAPYHRLPGPVDY